MKNITAKVHATLANHYPTHVLGWVRRATWKTHPAVPLSRIDMSRRPGGRDPAKVQGIADAVKAGKTMPPVVLVDTGDRQLQVADGYHRTLGFQKAGRTTIPALIASGVGKHGPWEKRMHAAKLNLTAGDTMAQRLLDLAGVCTGPGPCDTTPFGAGKNWVNKVGGLDPYLRAIAHALRRKGETESEAIQRAWGIIRNWARGEGGVTAETRARAAKAVANMERKRAQAHALTADPASTVDLAWDESLHPRNKGKFAPKGSTAASAGRGGHLPANMAANVRDFQKRNGLPVTGVIDQATASKIRVAAAAKNGGRRGGRKPKKPKPTPQMTAAARTINKLTPAQRAYYRKNFPTPAGYTWSPTNTLVHI